MHRIMQKALRVWLLVLSMLLHVTVIPFTVLRSVPEATQLYII